MATLEEKLSLIQQARNNIKISLENKGQTVNNDIRTYADAIDNISGTAEVTGAKVFETEEEMRADETAKEGDLAILYRNEIQNCSVDSQFSKCIFPETVVLPSAMTASCEVRFTTVDSSQMFDCMGNFDSSNFMMDCYMDSGSFRVNYSSSDGITYTRSSMSGDGVTIDGSNVDFGMEIKYYSSEYWNDNIGYFIQTGGSTFEGLYKCSEVGLLNNFIVNLGKFLYGDGKEVATFDFSDIPFSDMTEILNMTTYGLAMFVPLTWNDYILQGNTIHKVTSCWIFNDVSNVLIKNNNVAYMYSTSSSTEGGVITWNKDTGATKKTSSTMSSTALTSKKSTLYADYELTDKYFFKVNLSIQEHKFILLADTTFGCYCYDVDTFSSSVDDSSFTYNNFEQNYSEFKILKYLNAPSQLTLSASNQLLPNTIGYGNGVITGDGSIYMSNDTFTDTPAMLYDKIQRQYDNIEPRVLTDDNKTIDKNIYCIPTKRDGTPLLNTSSLTSMYYMFSTCKNLTTIPLLDTSNVTNMSWVFYECVNLIDIPLLDTSNATRTDHLFDGCTNLTTVPLLNTDKVTNTASMFNKCANLTTIPLLNTSNVTDMNSMFQNCTNLTTVPELDTSKVTNMNNVFAGCTNLTTIPLLDTSSAIYMNSMFHTCRNLATIPLLNTNKVTNMQQTFYFCDSLTTIPLLATSNVIYMNSMFYGCTSLISIPELNTSNVNRIDFMFYGCRNLTTIPLLNTSKVTNMNSMFNGCTSLSDESLNNILAMCKNATSYTNTKTLNTIGLTSEQATRCQTLSNYSAFTSAGWSTGY